MTDINPAGGNPQFLETHNSGSGETGEAKKTPGSGVYNENNLNVGDNDNENNLYNGQSGSGPDLDDPGDVKPTSLQQAYEDIQNVSDTTKKAILSTLLLVANAHAGTLTPEQVAHLKDFASTLDGVADYLNNILGKGIGNAEGKRSVLAGLGFNESQMEALLSLADPDDDGNSLASLHGGQGALKSKQNALKSIGFSESQIEAILSLANPDDDGNALSSLHQGGADPKGTLRALGFSAGQADRLLSLLNGEQAQGSAEQRKLLALIGFSKEELEVVLSAADPDLLRELDILAKNTSDEQVSQLREQAKVARLYSGGADAGERYIEQIVDLFMVFELLHEMSVQSRRIARETRSAEYDNAKQEILNQAQEMRDAAKFRLIGGMVSGAVKVAAGGVTAKGSSGAKGNPGKGADASARANTRAAATQAKIAKANAIAQGLNGAGEVASAGFNYQASLHDAQQKEHEAYQKTHENRAQAESEWMQLQQDMVKTVQSKMDEIIRTNNETNKSLSRG